MGDYEGKQDKIRALELPYIDTFLNVYDDRDFTINLKFEEFTAICPKTGLPDFGVVNITYKPFRLCAELKSLKLYLVAFREIGIFHENVVNKITDDFVKAVTPREFHISIVYNNRGGIVTTVTRDFTEEKKPAIGTM